MSGSGSDLKIREARVEDLSLVFQFIRELAEFEQLSADVSATEEQLRRTLFGPRPFAATLLGFLGDEPAGFAVYLFTYSTFRASPILYVEDVFVREPWRNRGVGRALFVEMFRIAHRAECGRVEWSVLDWNAPAIAFYERLGARVQREWLKCSLTVSKIPSELLS